MAPAPPSRNRDEFRQEAVGSVAGQNPPSGAAPEDESEGPLQLQSEKTGGEDVHHEGNGAEGNEQVRWNGANGGSGSEEIVDRAKLILGHGLECVMRRK